MTTILIADSCKPSLVMTSEVFKDKILGTVVDVALSGKDALEYLAGKRPDLCVVDFDLPDVDGPALVEAMRKLYDGPILMTAFPSEIVKQAVDEHLFTFNDASAWIAKPVNFEILSDMIDRFLLSKHRLEKRFDTEVEAHLVAKAAGRGKRAPKVSGSLVNMSLGGACVKVTGASKFKKSLEVTVSVLLPAEQAPVSAAPATGKKKKAGPALIETKIKAMVAWTNPKGEIGLQFAKLTDIQKKQLETFFKMQMIPKEIPAPPPKKATKSSRSSEARA